MASFLMFLGALAGIVVFAVVTNRLTGTTASYLESHQLGPDETTLWQDGQADFAIVRRLGGAHFRSYWRWRTTTIVWTNVRVLVARKVLFRPRRMITHQVYFADAAAVDPRVSAASQRFAGGFFGRGYQTVIAETATVDAVNGTPCIRIRPTEHSGAIGNIQEALIFSDRLPEFERVVGVVGPPVATTTR